MQSCLGKGVYEFQGVSAVFADKDHKKVKFVVGEEVVPVTWEVTHSILNPHNIGFTPLYKLTPESLAKLRGRHVTVTVPCHMGIIVINN
jgi:hypothetical protein